MVSCGRSGMGRTGSDSDPPELCRLTFDEDVELVDQSEQDPDCERDRERAAEVAGCEQIAAAVRSREPRVVRSAAG